MADTSTDRGPRRRDVLRAGGALALAVGLPAPAAATGREPRLVVVLMRGGLDGLAAVPPVGDPGCRPAPQARDLDGFFAMHESLPRLHARYRAGEAIVVHAAATRYRGRSHDEAEAALADAGWLNRAAEVLPSPPGLLAIGSALPPVLQGRLPAVLCTPAALAGDDAAGFVRRAAQRSGAMSTTACVAGSPGRGDTVAAAAAAARLLAAPDGPRIAVLACDGFDTHAGQEARLPTGLDRLDRTLAALADGLAPVWRETVVLAVSEFGRSLDRNAAGGTEHGLATAAFLVGGAVAGGRVLAAWPGLRSAPNDGGLAATTDLAAVFKGVLGDHLGIGERLLADRVFPDRAATKAVAGLVA